MKVIIDILIAILKALGIIVLIFLIVIGVRYLGTHVTKYSLYKLALVLLLLVTGFFAFLFYNSNKK